MYQHLSFLAATWDQAHLLPELLLAEAASCIQVLHWSLLQQLDADNYENDPELAKIQIERKYSWMDIITTDNDQLPHCKDKVNLL
ncbi:hypothetical protein Y1Q_0011262 [Alligator mississippiensis]|uniref:Uncharacterized protein n=1 Tax=Alligator mississippiensis TaxID=8496 RepID=A0A151N7Y7_ALLMI|nr:hypothetical protein Y1Q_0011262 [Alligator mississippiensis]